MNLTPNSQCPRCSAPAHVSELCRDCFRKAIADATPIDPPPPASVDVAATEGDASTVADAGGAGDTVPAPPPEGAVQEDEYVRFLASKALRVESVGITGDVELGAHLFGFQAEITRWALRRGRAAVFADCGLGKTPIALEWAHVVAKHTGKPVLILAPLAVAQQFVREGVKFGRHVDYLRDGAEFTGQPVVVTNYERLHKFDASIFGGVVADESSCLKHSEAATRAAVIEAFENTPFRLSCTASPSPNDYKELGGQAHFLGIMTEQEMMGRYFVHDGESSAKAGWRLKGHGRKVFWSWVCSWAVMIRRPSDLGHDDTAYTLPPIHRHSHVVPSDTAQALAEGKLFVEEARGLLERRRARRASLDRRVAVAAQLVLDSPADEQWLCWVDLNSEGESLQQLLPGSVQVSGSDSAEDKETRLLAFAEGRARILITKPAIGAWGLNLQGCRNMIFVGISDSFESLYQAERRCWRFGQTRDVHVHVVTSEAEGSVVANVERKARDAEAMADAMVSEMRELMRAEVSGARRDTDDYQPTVPMNVPQWLIDNARAA